MPELDFTVEGAEVLPYAAAPSLLFKLAIQSRGEPIRSILLNTQIRIATTRRRYAPAEQEQLAEVFGDLDRWETSLQSLLWTLTTTQVRPFDGRTVVDLIVPCTYDFEVASTKYFHALADGDVPLELLFSGTIFYTGPSGGLQVVQIPWDKEARFRLPVALWRQTMEHYFPNSAWVRLPRETFDRLNRFRMRRALPTWDAALNELLQSDEASEEVGCR